jgi:hypothetical protein
MGEAREVLKYAQDAKGDHTPNLLGSGALLSALWIAATLTAGMNANESLESLGLCKGYREQS